MVSRMGATMGTTTKVISIKSRMKPSRNISSMTMNMAPTTPPGRLVSSSRTTSSPPKPRNTSEKIDAPIRIMNTMQVTRRVLCITACRISRLNCFCRMANSMAPTAPTEAASVGVAMPAKIEPSTPRIRNSGGSRASTTRETSSLLSIARSAAGIAGT